MYLKMLNIELAREWSLRVLAECPLEKKNNRDARSGLSHNTFETVPTTWCLMGAAAFNGDARPAPLMCG